MQGCMWHQHICRQDWGLEILETSTQKQLQPLKSSDGRVLWYMVFGWQSLCMAEPLDDFRWQNNVVFFAEFLDEFRWQQTALGIF